MDAPKSPGLSPAVPVLTLLMAGGAMAATLVPGLAPWLVYNRPAILAGQIWRMWTGPWVHFSARHLVYDLIPWCVAGWIIQVRRLPRFRWFCALTPFLISAALLLFEPQMRFCGGFSGLDVAAIVFLALCGLSDPPPWRWVCAAALAATAGKLLFEFATGGSLFDTLDHLPVVASAASHAAGAAVALVFYQLRTWPWPRPIHL